MSDDHRGLSRSAGWRALVVWAAAALVGCTSSVPSVPSTAILTVVTATAGDDLDPNGYRVSLNSEDVGAIPVDGLLNFPTIDAGGYDVELTDIALNCSVLNANPRPIFLFGGDSARVSFAVSCEQS